MTQASAFYDPWVDLYDLMVDWDARLAREGPALLQLLAASHAPSVLDVACGTGRHVRLLRDAGLSAAGADAAPGMVHMARHFCPNAAFVEWSMAEPPPADLLTLAPFHALLCLGNSFPHLVADAEIANALRNFRSLLAPGGMILLGLKAIGLLKDRRQPLLPLVRRVVGPRTLFFVRFYDFAIDTPHAANFHLLIVDDAQAPSSTGSPHHAVTRLRAWRPTELARRVSDAGFVNVRVARDLTDAPWTPNDSEDIFLLAQNPV